MTSNVNTGGGHFSHFGTVGVNLFERFEAFGGNNSNLLSENNNNNNNPLSLLPLSGFEEGLGEGFNPLLGRNAERLDLNVTALINALTGANLEINHVERESNHVKLTEFRETEVEDPN